MTYQALARKWRPQDFASVVGQKPIVTALRNALTERRIAQAYLFSGIRGVGKTSVARILAKALNCENGPNGGPAPDPCNHCTPCEEITRGADLDVIEVDAATYSKVEQVRELTESLKYGPARDRYKVVVIDEVHRLSRQAFDALLKIVEEPPAHLVFIFATTEIDAVPATILSRCQEYRFHRVPTAALAAHLRTLCEAEDIEASDAALFSIARAGEGSVRDAIALLDQLATYGNGTITEDDAERVLGGVDASFFHRLLAAILAGERSTVSAMVGEVDEAGWDPRHIHGAFLAYCRNALHLAIGADAQQVDLPESDRTALQGLVADTGYENLLRLLHNLLGSEGTVRRSEVASLALEVAWLRAAELPRLVRLEELVAGAPSLPRRPASQPAARPDPAPPEEPTPASPRPQASSPDPAPKGPPAEAEPVDLDISRLLEEVNRRKPALAAHLKEALDLVLADGVLEIHIRAGSSWLSTRLAKETNKKALEAALADTVGADARWRLIESSAPPKKESPATPPEDPAGNEQASATDNPTVQAVLDIFGGTVEPVDQENDKPPDESL
jgi:DNA polymerase-3 subunit gamma/tau